jgi:alpha-beta hydrolase superfamily lysophospholipase
MLQGIPTIIWGEKSEKIYVFVHGKLSCKEAAEVFALKACQKGYQVISFDLPEHGERKEQQYACNPWNGLRDLTLIGDYIGKQWSEFYLVAFSLGAYFSLLAFKDLFIKKCLFVSPILDMKHLIENMMLWSEVDEDMLKEKKEIPTAMGETLSLEYYSYVKEHPISKWDIPTKILYGQEDHLMEREIMDDFVRRFKSELTVLKDCSHSFNTPEHANIMEEWLDCNID